MEYLHKICHFALCISLLVLTASCKGSSKSSSKQPFGGATSGETETETDAEVTDLTPGAKLTATSKFYSIPGNCTANVTDIQFSLNGSAFSQINPDHDCSDLNWNSLLILDVGVNEIIFRFYVSEESYSEILIEVTLDLHKRRWFLQSDGDDSISVLRGTSNQSGDGVIVTAGVTGGSGNFDISSVGSLPTSGSPGDGFIVVNNRLGPTLGYARFTGPGSMTISDVKTASTGEYFLVGGISGNDAGHEIDLDPSSGSTANVDTNNDSEDGYILGLTSGLNYGWHIVLASPAADRVNTVDFLADGNLLVGGCVSGNTEFDPKVSAGGKAYTHSGTGENVFLAIYDSTNGDWIADYQFDMTGDGCIVTSAADSLGNIYLAGYFSDAGIDFNFNGGAGGVKSSAGNKDYFILKVNSLGQFISVQTKGTASDEEISTIAVDSNNDVIVAGNFTGPSFQPSFSGAGSLLTNSGSMSSFVMKISGGSVAWTAGFDAVGGQTSYIPSITVDTSGKPIFPVQATGNVDLDPGVATELHEHTGNTSSAIVKLGINGELIKNYSQDTDDTLKMNNVYYLSSGSFLIGGDFKGAVNDFDFGLSEQNSASTDLTSDGFIVELND